MLKDNYFKIVFLPVSAKIHYYNDKFFFIILIAVGVCWQWGIEAHRNAPQNGWRAFDQLAMAFDACVPYFVERTSGWIREYSEWGTIESQWITITINFLKKAVGS